MFLNALYIAWSLLPILLRFLIGLVIIFVGFLHLSYQNLMTSVVLYHNYLFQKNQVFNLEKLFRESRVFFPEKQSLFL